MSARSKPFGLGHRKAAQAESTLAAQPTGCDLKTKIEVVSMDQKASLPANFNSPRLLRVPQAAAYLGMSIWMLRQMAAKGTIPVIQPEARGVLLFDRVALDRWIDLSSKEAL